MGIGIFLSVSSVRANQDLISLFPIENYNQNLNDWIKPGDSEGDKPLLPAPMQEHHLAEFYKHYYGNFSPWDAGYINQLTHKPEPDNLQTIERSIILSFNNQNAPAESMGYGANFRPYSAEWINTIADNINLSQLANLNYQAENRAITIDNLQARGLPTEDVFFYSYKLPGEGYPFDNLQMSTVWAGTPVYIFAETKDHSWSLVLTPEFIGWVKTNGLARANNSFIHTWTHAAKKSLIAIIRTKASINDENHHFHFLAYVGSVFPGELSTSEFKIMIPVANTDHQATIKYAQISTEDAVIMPWSATAHHFSIVMSSLIGRPYGWGGMYFYNDCSAELKSLLTPFGLWLPRHSSDQVYVGKMMDLGSASPEQRLSYLTENGHRFLTLVYIGGHVFLYIGNFPNPQDPAHPLALSYQNLWGLSPRPAVRRAVVGKAVIFPLLLQYSEDTSLISPAAKKHFQVSYLDELPNYQLKLESIDLRALMDMS